MSQVGGMPIHSYKIAIAGLTLGLDCDSAVLRQQFSQRYAAFASQQPAVLSAQIEWQDALSNGALPLSYDFAFEHGRLVFALPDYQGEIDLASHHVVLHLRASQPFVGVEYFIRTIYALWLFEMGGLLLHSAGLVRDGAAYLFFGHSGSGKTTVSRLSPTATVLNDDLIALWPTATGWVAHSTPFWNPTQVKPVSNAAPLAGLFRLVQDQRVWLEDVTPALAVAELAASAPIVSADAQRSAMLVARCTQLLRQVSLKRLHFRKDDSFWDVVLGKPGPAA
jgi:hypothetical protein